MQQNLDSLRGKAIIVYDRLLKRFGLPKWRDPLPAIDELVSTILSQNTNDKNRDVAFNALIARFPTWEEVRDADPDEVINEIRPAGLANQKGPRMQKVLRQITEERGELNLDFLKDYAAEDALAWLTRFNGVGPKTASIVLQFALDIPAFPVDTHIYRVSGRLGLRPDKMTADQAHTHLAALFPPETYGPGHLNLIRLGREICLARKPKCEQCPLNDLCDYYHSSE
jgi:endonuclease-3